MAIVEASKAMTIAALVAASAAAAWAGDIYTLVLADRLEYQSHDGDPLFVWDAQGWLGGDLNKLWIKTKGEKTFEDNVDGAELQVLYSRAFARYWDLQAGVRHDFEPDPSRTFAVIGVQGLAPYWFDVDAALFVSEDGDVSMRAEAERDVLVTQRLVAQPRVELNVAVQDVEHLGIGSGLTTAELGLRVRYEIKREFAPYIGVSWTRRVGDTADFARARDQRVGDVSFVAGLRMWL